MKKHKKTTKHIRERGVILLIAVLLASITLVVGLGVYHRTYKEILFSAFWKQAQIAFASADGALECALYFELHPLETTDCFGVSPIPGWTPGTPGIPGTFSISTGTVCARVDITYVGNTKTIKAYGYNTCDTSNPRRVERGLEVTYGG